MSLKHPDSTGHLFSALSPFRIVIIFVAIAAAVCVAIPRLSINLLPQANTSAFDIYYSRPDASPDLLEQQVTSVIENTCSQLSQLKKISSVSNYGNGHVRLEFDKHTDMPLKRLEVAAIIRRIYPQLGSYVSYPEIRSSDNNEELQSPLLVYSVNAPLQPYYVRQQVEDVVRKNFAGISAIREIAVSGAPSQQLTIRFDQEKCHSFHVPPTTIMAQVQSFFTTTYPGSTTNETGQVLFMQLRAPAPALPVISNMLVRSSSGEAVRLKDIAEVYVEEAEAEAAGYSRVNGQNAVSISFYARKGMNQIVTARQIKQTMPHILRQLPPGYSVDLQYDDTRFLETEINKNYRRTLLSVTSLLLFILLAYRNTRFLFNLFTSLLITLCFTILLAWYFNINIHLYTIAGLAISVGIMTDNAIVMLDHYHRFRNRNIYMALMTATCITIAALLLVFLLPEKERTNLTDFALIIILALLSSLITALCFIPGLYLLTQPARIKKISAGFLRIKSRIKAVDIYYACIERIARYRLLLLTGILLIFGLPVFLLPAKLEGYQWYYSMYNSSIGSTYYQEHLRAGIDKWTGGVLRLFVSAVTEKSGYRTPQQTKLYVDAALPVGNTPVQMNRLLENLEKKLDSVKGVDKYITRVYNGQKGSIEISFTPAYEHSSLPYLLKNKLIDLTTYLGGVEWSIYGVGQGFSSGANDKLSDYKIIMKGYNYDDLEKKALILGDQLQQHNRVTKINTDDRLDYNIQQGAGYLLQLNNNAAAQHHVNGTEAFNAVRKLTRPTEPVSQLFIFNKYLPVVFKEKKADEFSSYDLLHTTLQPDSNHQVKMANIATVVPSNTINSIHKEDRQYIRAVTFNFTGSAQLAADYIENALQKLRKSLPAGYTAIRDLPDHDWTREKNSYFLIGLIMLAIFFLCSVLFESLKSPMCIIIVIPVSFIGLFLTFKTGGFYFDQGGYAAFIMLSGLIANAGIFLVNDYIILKKRLRPKSNAENNRLIIRATFNRSRTILLTTFSTCCGLIPFIVEGQHEVFWFSLSVGTIGGLFFSLPVIFILLPVLLWKR